MFCSNCGKNLPDGASFCPSCGTSLNPPQQEIAQPFATNASTPAGVSGVPTGLNGVPAGVSGIPYDNNTLPKKSTKKVPIIIGVAAVAVIAIIAILIFSLSNAPSGSEDQSKGTMPTNAYDIAGIMGMKPSEIESWLYEQSFDTYDGGGNSFARVVINGTKEVPASEDPSSNTGWNTLSVQSYTFYSATPSGTNIDSVFNMVTNEISPSSLASSNPHALLYVSTERAKNSSDLPSSTKSYLTKILNQANLSSADTKEANSSAYAIGSCQIDGKEGLWIACAEKAGSSYYGYILCGYSDEMKQSLNIDGATSSALSKLLGTSSTSGSSSSSSSSSGSSSSSSSSNNSGSSSGSSSSSSSSGSSSSSSGSSSSSSISSSSLAGTWKDPDYSDTMTLSSDGSAVITQDGKRFAGTWKANSNGITFTMSGGKQYVFELSTSGNKMTLYNSEKNLRFDKSR